MKGTLHEDQHTFLIISRSFLSRMRNVSDKSCRENQNTHFVVSNFFSKIGPFMIKRAKIFVERGRPQTTIWRMRIACWLPRTINTRTQNCVILDAFPLQQWLHKPISILRYAYVACIVYASSCHI